ncbi:MAG: hypothetical protein ACU0C8_13540, partial [Roseovarius sp.]
QKSHVYHSNSPQLNQAGARLHMGQFSMTISAVAGSVLSDNQQIYLHPVVLGSGTPYFAGPRPPLRLVSHERIGEDVVRLAYAPA